MSAVKDYETQEVKINTRVLVIGGGMTAVSAADRIAGQGYPVVLCAQEKAIGLSAENRPMLGLTDTGKKSLEKIATSVQSNGNITIKTGTGITRAQGVSGDFTIRLESADGMTDEIFGSVVIATDFAFVPLKEFYGVDFSETVLSQSVFEEKLAAQKDSFSGKTVLFVTGLAQEGSPLVMERVFRSVLSLTETPGCTPYVLTGDLKVASENLEQIYKLGRDKGAVYFKVGDKPEISQDGKKVVFTDPVLRQRMELAPDILVVEEAVAPDPYNLRLSEVLRIDMGAEGFLQTDNVHMLPVRTNREGIYVAGGARDVKNLPESLMDIDNISNEIHSFLDAGVFPAIRDRAVVDEKKCVICLTCYRCCPHGAICWEANRAVISVVACQGCGICASECPQDAISLVQYRDEEIKDQIQKGISEGEGKPRILAFCCENSANEAFEMAKDFHMELPKGLRVIPVPCAGKVDHDFIMTALADDADGVLVFACHPGNCRSERGNTFAKWRVEEAHRMLGAAGVPKERLAFATISSNMGREFVRIVKEMEDQIRAL